MKYIICLFFIVFTTSCLEGFIDSDKETNDVIVNEDLDAENDNTLLTGGNYNDIIQAVSSKSSESQLKIQNLNYFFFQNLKIKMSSIQVGMQLQKPQ